MLDELFVGMFGIITASMIFYIAYQKHLIERPYGVIEMEFDHSQVKL